MDDLSDDDRIDLVKSLIVVPSTMVESYVGNLYCSLEGDFLNLLRPDAPCQWVSKTGRRRNAENSWVNGKKTYEDLGIAAAHRSFGRSDNSITSRADISAQTSSAEPEHIIHHTELSQLLGEEDPPHTQERSRQHKVNDTRKNVRMNSPRIPINSAIETSFKRKFALLNDQSRREADTQQARIFKTHLQQHIQRTQSSPDSKFIISGAGRRPRLPHSKE